MGGSQSARKLTVDNDDPANVIKVSESVVERLKAMNAQQQTGASVSQPVYPSAGTPPPYFYQPSLTSLQVQKDKEAQLRNNDQYWQKRLVELEQSHKKIDHIMEDEYNKAIDEVKLRFQNLPPTHQAPSCQEGKLRVLECYKNHPKQPMLCAKEVNDFANCVDSTLAKIIASRG